MKRTIRLVWAATLATALLCAGSVLAESPLSPPLAGTLLYSKITDGTWQIWRTNLTTNETTQVTFTPGDKRRPTFAPEGSVAFCTANQACFVSRGKNEERLLPDLWPLRDVAWSLDGGHMAFSKFRTDLVDSANLWLADGTGDHRRILTHEQGIQQHPAWSRDGQWLAYSSGNGRNTHELYVVRADGTDLRQLTKDQSHEFFPAWSPDGTRIAFSSDRSGEYEIWTMRADGSELTQLTQSAGLDTNPVWSPDGSHIAFATNRRGTLELWIMRADGTEPQVLEAAEGGICDPAWR